MGFRTDKVLIDGRARKYCAKSIYDMIIRIYFYTT